MDMSQDTTQLRVKMQCMETMLKW